MTGEQIREIRHIAWAAEELGKIAAKARKAIDKAETDAREALEVVLPEWFDENEYQALRGDASKANTKHFRVYWRAEKGGGVEVVIICPTFLRGHLRLHVSGEHVGGSY